MACTETTCPQHGEANRATAEWVREQAAKLPPINPDDADELAALLARGNKETPR